MDQAEREECQERQTAELEFVAAAYDPKEAWYERKPCSSDRDSVVVHRLLELPFEQQETKGSVWIRLSLTLPSDYPIASNLQVNANVWDDSEHASKSSRKPAPPHVQKMALDALPQLVTSCRQVANDHEEAIFVVFSQADEWIQDSWNPNYSSPVLETARTLESSTPSRQVLGRRLIYSHHIISKVKRADMKRLASDCQLTGYMKIGWPGLLILEGLEESCEAFISTIRRWQWKYLAVRGEQQEDIEGSLDSQRCFSEFIEEGDMSVVAQHCREVGLEALFRTSMKLYNNADNPESTNILHAEEDNEGAEPIASNGYSTLVLVDHMNDGKGYRKWLRKTSTETGCQIAIQQCYPLDDYSKRPKIFVGIVGDTTDVSAFMKRWRTSRVDVDGRGKQCLERKMTVLVEGKLPGNGVSLDVDWERLAADDCTTTSQAKLRALLVNIGGEIWAQAFQEQIENR